jgi:glycosyltransferase involved in cell wall biosynthesis
VDVSVVVCTHNPRPDYLRRTLNALAAQTLPREAWELLVVDNASTECLADSWDLSWHPRGRHVREPRLGLIWARISGIAETRGDLLVFVDDDNLLAPAYLEQALEIARQWPYVGVFGPGRLEPEFETEPPPRVRAQLYRLALRDASSPRWGNNPGDADSVPWGAGLCVDRRVATGYRDRIDDLGVADVLGRRGRELCAGEDELFSWVSAAAGLGCGVFPELRVTHLIPGDRLREEYLLRLIQDHAFSHGVLRYRSSGRHPRRISWERRVRLLLHGMRRGAFSMRCEWAVSRGEERAARYVVESGLPPGPIETAGDRVSIA